MQYIDVDKIIIFVFLAITLIVGIIAGKDVKNIKDYAIANGEFGTPVLLLTLLATMIGGSSTTGDVAQIFEDGLIYLMASLSSVIATLSMAYYIAPKFDSRFNSMISVCDIVKYFYGVNAEKFSGLIGFVICIGFLAMQLIALGHLATSVLNIDYTHGVLITGGLVIAYSTFGGIRSVTMTDVLQFGVLIIMLPLIANVATNQVGGLNKVFSGIDTYHQQFFDHPKFYQYLFLSIFLCLPFGLFFPSIIQRYLMAQNNKQVAQITYTYSILQAVTIFMATCIALSALKLYPNAEPKAIIPSIINDYMPPFIKGLVISGMLAVLMSTADSLLNSAGILIAHNVLPKKVFKGDIKKLSFMKLCTLVTGILSMLIALKNYSIINVSIISFAFSATTFGIPLTFAMLGLKVKRISFWTGSFSSFMAFFITQHFKMGYEIPIFTTVISFLGFIIPHLILNRGFALLPSSQASKKGVYKKAIWNLTKFIKKHLPTPRNVFNYSKNKVEKFGANHLMFGIFCCINYIVPYFMWTHHKPINYPVMLGLRLIAGMLCVGLLMKDYWPQYLKKYFPLYWHFTLIYCLPFVTTIMFIMVNADVEWLINLTLAIMLLAMLVDWASFILIFLIGVSLGYTFYQLVIGNPALSVDFDTIYLSIYVCIFATLIGLLFARRKEIDAEEKLEVMRLFGGAMAHEVKTPLASINMCAQHVNITLSRMIAILEENKTDIVIKECSELQDLSLTLRKISSQGINTVSSLLTSLKSSVIAVDKSEYFIAKCIDQVLTTYETQFINLENIKLNISNNFRFYGSMYYMEQVLSNLLSNAYKYGGSNVSIDIWSDNNKLYIQDNGKGISPEDLPHIFDRFYTKSKDGTGIGLAFCKMVMEDMGGTITCKSEVNKYTQFILEFPKLRNQHLEEVLEKTEPSMVNQP